MAGTLSSPLIVTAELGAEDFAWLDGLRRRHYPPERNQLAAHLTMFHAIPPSAEQEVRGRLAACTKGPTPAAKIAGVMNLGGGVAFRVVSDDLEGLRDELADHLHGLLTAQDAAGWGRLGYPHPSLEDLVSARIHGVSPEFAAEVAKMVTADVDYLQVRR